MLKTWSSTQNVIALSSGEAEFYAIVKAGSQSLGIREMFRDLGIEVAVKLLTDGSVAKGITARRGLGPPSKKEGFGLVALVARGPITGREPRERCA